MDKNTRGLSDKDVEKAWESLENEPFTTNDNGEQVLDSENGWFGFGKGTTQQEIWRWFDTHHSKGVAYLVNDYEPEENIEIQNEKRNKNMAEEKTLSWDEIQQAADGAHRNDDALAVKNRAKEQAVEFANEIGAEINTGDEDDIESFVKDCGITFQPDGTMSENRYVLVSENPQFGRDYGIQDMLSKFLEEETEKNISDNKGKEFASNFSRERFASGDLATIINYANHLGDGSVQWMLGARAGNERQLYYRDPTQLEEWKKATAQEFFDFTGDFYARNYDPQNELDQDSLSLMHQLFPNSKDIEKFWNQHYTKDDMALEDVNDLSDHSAHGEIWNHLPSVDESDNPYVILEDAISAAASYLENWQDELKDKSFGSRSDSTEEEKTIKNGFLDLLRNVNNALHSEEIPDYEYDIENATDDNLDLLHAEVLKDCAALAREDFLSSFGEIIEGEFPNQEEAEYRRLTLDDLRIDEKNLDNYLDSNASRLIENVYKKAKSIRGVDMIDFIEATVDTSDPADEHEMEWNRALEELLDGYTSYKDFNEKWETGLTPANAMRSYLESEKELMHIAFENALGNDSVEVPANADKYKEYLDSIDFDGRFSYQRLANQEREAPDISHSRSSKQETVSRISEMFKGKTALDTHGNLKNFKSLVDNYKENNVKNPVEDALSTMLYETRLDKDFYSLSPENFDNIKDADGTELRQKLCDIVAKKIVTDPEITNKSQIDLAFEMESKFLTTNLKEKNMEEKNTGTLSNPEQERLSKLFEGMTCLDSYGTSTVDFNGLVDDYKENKDPETALKDAASMMIYSNRNPQEYYSLSTGVFDSESDAADILGDDTRRDLCDVAAEKIVADKSITNMDNVEKILSDESSSMAESFFREHGKGEESPDIATWAQLEHLVGKDSIDFVKEDALQGNPDLTEKEWKAETLARALEDGILDKRGFETSSTNPELNKLQFDSDFTKSGKWNLYEEIEPEKWRIIDTLAGDIVSDRETLDNGDIGLGDIQSKFDDMLSESEIYRDTVEQSLVSLDNIMADTIDMNINPLDTSDGLKIKMIEAYTKNSTPEWSKPERFIVTPSELSSDYTASEFKQFLESYRDTSKEPGITEKQAETIMKYLRENDYAAFVDQKGNLLVADFSEDFNLDEAAGGGIYKTKDLVELTSDLISKDDGFSDDYEKDMNHLKPLFDYYIKPKAFQTEISPEKQLLQSLSEKINKTLLANNLLPDKETIGAAFKYVLGNYGVEDRQKIRSIMLLNGCKDAGKTDVFMKNIQEKNFEPIKLKKPEKKKEPKKEYKRER